MVNRNAGKRCNLKHFQKSCYFYVSGTSVIYRNARSFSAWFSIAENNRLMGSSSNPVAQHKRAFRGSALTPPTGELTPRRAPHLWEQVQLPRQDALQTPHLDARTHSQDSLRHHRRAVHTARVPYTER